jgi:hypothetical protein
MQTRGPVRDGDRVRCADAFGDELLEAIDSGPSESRPERSTSRTSSSSRSSIYGRLSGIGRVAAFIGRE